MKKTVLVDLDATIAEYDKWRGVDHFGPPIEGAREFLEALSAEFKVVIYTTRCNPDVNTVPIQKLLRNLQQYLKRYRLPYDDIAIGKPICVAIIDDRAVSCRPQGSLDSRAIYNDTLVRVRQLAGNKN